jgi:large subunit ribosomal protein L4
MASAPVVDRTGKKVGDQDLPADLFEAPVNVPLMHQVVVAGLASLRAGTHSTKTRAEVSGGGKKPWRQKGTGRARQGSIRATQWKGGGRPFGPTPRSYDQAMPRAMRREALRAAVAGRLAGGEIAAIEALGASDGKTKTLVGELRSMGVTLEPTLLVVAELGEPLRRAARNVPWLTVETPTHVSVYELLRARRVVFERRALQALEEALEA